MAITAIKDFKIKESYTKLVEKALFSYLWEGIYKPMFEILDIKPIKAKNEYSIILDALRNGKIIYADGAFRAKNKFSNEQSLELRKWGARWDKRERVYRLPENMLPDEIRVAVAEMRVIAEQKIKLIQEWLKEVENNIPYMVESMVFDEEVITILDDAGNEVKKNIKHLNVIEPELSTSQKLEIARAYTENMRDYVIKDFANERIPEMRRKIQELVLQGYRADKVQELLQKEYGIMSRKAKFLAQNETTIMLAEYKKVTYKEMGFNKFIWKTITDGRERDLHQALNNTVWDYDNPPVIDERTGQRGLPGQTYNCRCTQVPYREDSPFSYEIEDKHRYNRLISSAQARNSSDDVDWITVKGNHIPIKEGQTKEEAVKEFLEKKGNSSQKISDDGIKSTVKKLYETFKDVNCESTKPAYKYPETIAGVKRGKPMSFEQADSGHTNPNYNRKNYAYSKNCQCCVVSHELRIRGYDVKAAPRARTGKTTELAYHSAWAWLEPKTNKKCEYTKMNVKNSRECINYLQKNIKPNERYQIAYSWKNTDNDKTERHGHVLTISRNSSGMLQMYDPQNNKIYTERNIERYFSRPSVIYNEPKLQPRLLRVDDKKVNPYFMDDVVHKN